MLLTVWFEYLLVRHDTRRAEGEIFHPWDARSTNEVSAVPVEKYSKPNSCYWREPDLIGAGIWCEALLHAGHLPIVLDNLSTGSLANVPDGVIFIQGDVRNPADVATAFNQSPDAVMHVAGQASIRLSFLDPAVDLAVNTQGTISNILQACIAHRVSS